MKIETDIKDNFFAHFDEARGIAIHKSKIIKKRKVKCLSYMQGQVLTVIFLLVAAILLSMLCCKINYIFIPVCILLLSAFLYLIYIILTIVGIYIFRIKQNFKNTITLNKEGITDKSFYGIKILFDWSKITAVVVGKYTVTILTDTPVYFYFDISKKDKILNAIKKYDDIKKVIE